MKKSEPSFIFLEGSAIKKSDLTKARILEAAGRLLATKGLHSTRTADLAAEAGLSEGALFRYFPSKRHLFAAAIRMLLERFTREMEEALDGAMAGPVDQALDRVLDFHFSFFTREENIALVFLGLMEFEGFDRQIRLIIRRGLLPYMKKISALLERGISAGIYHPGDSSLMAMSLLGMLQATIFPKIIAGAGYSFDEAKAEIGRIFLNGISSREGEKQ